ncbi:hypothetical protein H4R26_005798, partial [Coemansia thaxteri]
MVLFCYHIPTETWTEVHNSARAAALFATNSSLCGSAKPAEQRVGSGKGIKYVETNDSVPPFPPSRYAQDWVFDKATRRHFMFGGNPNRPNDKSARFNDTWELQLSRPTSRDILRRALYLVRQQRFLDMCASAGAHSPAFVPSTCSAPPSDFNDSVSEYKASAIPSPNSALLGSPVSSLSPTKRLSPLPADGQVSEHHSQRQRVVDVALPSRNMTRASMSPVIPGCTLRDDLASTPLLASGCAGGGSGTAQALAYLQEYVAPLVNYDDMDECQAFHALSTALFQIPAESRSAKGTNVERQSLESMRRARTDIYEA